MGLELVFVGKECYGMRKKKKPKVAGTTVPPLVECDFDENGKKISLYYKLIQPRFEDIFREIRVKGATTSRLCDMLGVSVNSYNRYKKEHPEFAELLNVARMEQVDEVYAAMYQRARGYTTTIKEERMVSGDKISLEKEQHVAASERAADLFLRNKDDNYKGSNRDMTGNSFIQVNASQLTLEIGSAMKTLQAFEKAGITLDSLSEEDRRELLDD